MSNKTGATGVTGKVTKQYRTNSNHVRAQVRQHIIDAVSDWHDNVGTIEDASQVIMNEFNRWDCAYERGMIPNNQARFSHWLWGLPFNFQFSYWDIVEFLNGLGINPEDKEYDSDKSAKLYHYLIWREIQIALK
ncbi:MAG: hypothetical protein HRU12_19375 [Phaeodactylibacter sp.]|nr:hypothetical protein [Phaeodactylibacter sp.]